ncbi:SDR family NAD(P)-dependent oxidoreductase [Roseomonas marmotae]|uniref:SDR family oxidoreductase n=1 Tax=Roseomonas marmotae TaxID=2768161 RepID=A0ABS3KB80_9PROT|nr:SDR family NAD(P)-dependent oxidoreductase [Roseomonas marmotae]MBO1074697.1 SDR family oxidoreductase [Roseomonas marmotae]QTI81714.1 SDR family oxidoreductase [Roseomonas marmotae]
MVFPGRFQGRTAIVTGGASGIGLGIATRLAAEGARLCLWDLGEEALSAARRQTGACAVQALDIADPAQVTQAMEESLAALDGRLDVLVCSAGITGPNVTVRDYPVEAWQRVIDVNLNGLFYCNRAAVPAMERNGYGRIVNIASVAGKEGNPNASAYSTSKAGVIGFTKSLGKELAKSEIRVNCVTPAAVRTAIFDQMTQEHIDFMLSKIPIGRFGGIDEVTSLVCWLASEECSFSTGAAFDVSGGRATY